LTAPASKISFWRKARCRIRHFGLLLSTIVGYCVVNRRISPFIILALLLTIAFATTATYVVTPLLYPLF
jgi:hypothetical protein